MPSNCLASASMFYMFINIIITTLIAIVKPIEQIESQERKKPPFFFNEVRIGQLLVTGLYNVARLIYEGTKHDSLQSSTMIVIAVRICVTMVVIIEHRWLCRHWEEFYVKRTKKKYLWFRFFCITCFIHCATGIRQMALTNDGIELFFSFLGGLNMIFWYYWGKKFQWKEDMTDSRRLIALRNGMSFVTVIYLIYSVYDILVYDMISASLPLVVTCGHFVLSMVLFYVSHLERTNRRGFWHTYNVKQIHVSELQPSEKQQVEADEKMDATGEENKHDGIQQENQEKNHDDGIQANRHENQQVESTYPISTSQKQSLSTSSNDKSQHPFSPTIHSTVNATENVSSPSRIPRIPRFRKVSFSSLPLTARSMRMTWSIMQRSSINVRNVAHRKVLEKHLHRQDIVSLIGDKMITVIAQVLFWFAVVYIAEAIVTWIFQLPGFWCQDFNYDLTDVTGGLQRIADMI